MWNVFGRFYIYRHVWLLVSFNSVILTGFRRNGVFYGNLHIKLEDFIKAPYEIYLDESYFELDYYTTLKATKAYTLFMKRKQSLDPDSDEQLQYTIESLKFISQFCKDEGINIDSYVTNITGDRPSYILHLKEHRINVYTLFGFSNFEKSLKTVDSELIGFILGEDFLNNLSTFRLKFFNSKKSKKLIELGIQKINKNNT